MTTVVAEVLFFAAIVVVIVIHEGAHFAVAKWFGIKVEEYFVGFGPRLWSFRRGETEYGIKAIPAGGYVRIAGMNPFEEISREDLPRTFGAKPIWQRASVIFAGPSTHFVLAFLFFALWLGLVGQPRASSTQYVNGIIPESAYGQQLPAVAAGFKVGDEIVGVGTIRNPSQAQFSKAIDATGGATQVKVTVLRAGRSIPLPVTPVMIPAVGRPLIGLSIGPRELPRLPSGFLGALTGAWSELWQTLVGVVSNLGRVFDLRRIWALLFSGAQRSPADVTSVVGTAQIAGQVARRDPGDVLDIFAVVNVFVGVLNLLPLLPFDGGHLALLGVEKVRGKKVDPRRLVPISAAVATFLIVFMVAIVYLDIVKPVPSVFP